MCVCIGRGVTKEIKIEIDNLSEILLFYENLYGTIIHI